MEVSLTQSQGRLDRSLPGAGETRGKYVAISGCAEAQTGLCPISPYAGRTAHRLWLAGVPAELRALSGSPEAQVGFL